MNEQLQDSVDEITPCLAPPDGADLPDEPDIIPSPPSAEPVVTDPGSAVPTEFIYGGYPQKTISPPLFIPRFIFRLQTWVALFLILALAAIITPNFNRARAQAKKKQCVSNLKTIEGACELYLMEKAVACNTSVDVEKLVLDGYLKTTPQCPSGGIYTIIVGSAAGGGGGSGATVIKCSTHQGIDDTTTCFEAHYNHHTLNDGGPK